MRLRIVKGIAQLLLFIGILCLAFNVQSVKTETEIQATIHWTKYHDYGEIVDILLALNATYPNIVDVFSIGRSWQNQTIYCVRLTNEDTTHPRPKTLFVGYHHARERITVELPLYFVTYAVESYGKNATITRLLDLSETYVVLALNVDGFDAVGVNEWQRKNARPFDEDEDGFLDEDPPDDEDNDGFIELLWQSKGSNWEFVRWEGVDDDGDGFLNEDWIGGVDLNRNYGHEWNASVESGSANPQDLDYRGPSAFSEPETQAIRDLVIRNDFKYAISFHSGADVILYPWGYTATLTSDDQRFQEIANNMSVLVGSTFQQSSLLYTTSGAWDDWVYSNSTTIALTCEIYKNNSAWQYEPGPTPDSRWEKGVFHFFNPKPDLIESTLQRWMPIFTYVSNRTISEYDLLLGDLNYDGIVDIHDVVAVSRAFDSEPGDINWNADADVAGPDGKIDIFDVVTVTLNFGKTA